MTYRRQPNSFSEAATALLRAGQDWLAERLGVTPVRLRQLANPMTNHLDVVDLVCRADIACAASGYGTPVFNEYRRRLLLAGAIVPNAPERRASAIAQAARAAAVTLRALADALLAVLNEEPKLHGVAA